MSDKELEVMSVFGSREELSLRVPKVVAKISICGGLTFIIDDDMSFTKPTPEQIKNLHDMLCIDVELMEEE